jgi:hypothetical protein
MQIHGPRLRRFSGSLVSSALPTERKADESGIGFITTTPLWLLGLLSLVSLVIGLLLAPSEWRLLSCALGALFFNTAVAMLTWRRWKDAVGVFGFGINYVLQAFFLCTLTYPASSGQLSIFQPYDNLFGREPSVALLLVMPALATLTILSVRALVPQAESTQPVPSGHIEIATDPRLPSVLIFTAVASLLYWLCALFQFGFIKAILETLFRTLMFVPFFAGYFFRVSRIGSICWISTLAVNVLVGTLTGGRAAAFMPIILYSVGAFFGAGARQRWIIVVVIAALAAPGAYIFGMIEVARSEVGRFSIANLSGDRARQVVSRLGDKQAEGRDDYERLPSMVRTNIRLVTWPALVVAAQAGGGNGNYRGFADLSEQITASLNVVVLTRTMSEYYGEGLWNLRASDYGFRVDEGTSVEFGVLAESWDRGGPWAAYIYSLLAVLFLWVAELVVRRLLIHHPALKAVGACAVFATAYWSMNTYNLPLALRHMVVNLLVFFAIAACFMLFSSDEQVENQQAGGAVKMNPASRFLYRSHRRN